MKLSESCKAPENKSDYIWKNSFATTSMTFQRSLICQQKFKQMTVEGKLYQLSERGCTSPEKCYNSCRIIQEQQWFQNCLFNYKKEL